jgi:hypothetical protein
MTRTSFSVETFLLRLAMAMDKKKERINAVTVYTIYYSCSFYATSGKRAWYTTGAMVFMTTTVRHT